MDSMGWTDDIGSKSVESFGNPRNVGIRNKHCNGICKVIPHSQYALVQSSCPLPDNVMIGVLGRPPRINGSHDRKQKMKKQLLEMLQDSEVILKKANYLKEHSRILLEDCSSEKDIVPHDSAGKNNLGL